MCFHHRLKNDLEVGREGFQVLDMEVERCSGSGDGDEEEGLGSRDFDIVCGFSWRCRS